MICHFTDKIVKTADHEMFLELSVLIFVITMLQLTVTTLVLVCYISIVKLCWL